MADFYLEVSVAKGQFPLGGIFRAGENLQSRDVILLNSLLKLDVDVMLCN